MTIAEDRKAEVAKYRKLYDQQPTYKMSQHRRTLLKRMAEVCASKGCKSWLDLGCGRGESLEILEKRFDAQGYEVVQKLCGHRVKKFLGIHKIPEEGNSFDVVSALAVLQHVLPADTENALKEMKRVARRAVYLSVDWGPDAWASKVDAELFVNRKPYASWVAVIKEHMKPKKISYQQKTPTSAHILAVL